MAQADKLVDLARSLVNEWPGFFEKKGAGAGDLDTNAYMKELRKRAEAMFGEDFAEKRICGETKLSVDYYFPDEGTIIEIAMSLRNPSSEYERDILKAVMAQEEKHKVQRLIFLSKPGATARCSQPGHRAFADWVERKHQIAVQILEFAPVAEQILEPTADEPS